MTAAVAGVGAVLADGSDGVVIQSLEPKGSAQASGMLKAGDVLLRIDDTKLDGMPAAKAHQLLQGPAGTYIRIRYRRPPNRFDMNCTLLRETGTEHILTEQHGGWKTIDLTDNRAREEEARRRAEGIYSGQEKINQVAFHGHHDDKMTAEELAAYQARRQAEDEANAAAADKYVAGLQAQNGHGKQGNTHKSWFAIPFMHGDDGAPNKDEKSSWFGGGAGGRQQTGARDKADGWFGWGGSDTKKEEKHWADWMPSYKHGDTREKKAKVVKAATFGKDHDVAAAALEYKVAKTNNQIHDFLHGKPKKKEWWDFGTNSETQRKKPGEHHWPWESRPAEHDSKFLEKDIPMPWEVWCGPKKSTGKR